MFGAEVKRVDAPVRRRVRRPAKRDKLGQVFVERAEAVVNPRAEAGLLLVEPVAARVDLVLGEVVVVRRPHVAHEREVVRARREVRPPVGHLHAALAARREAHLHRIDTRIHVPHVDLLRGHGAEALVVLVRRERVRQRRLVERQPRVFGQRRLGVKRLDVAITAAEKNPDDRLGLRCEVRPAVGRGKFRQCR